MPAETTAPAQRRRAAETARAAVLQAISLEEIVTISCAAKRPVELPPGPWRVEYEVDPTVLSSDGSLRAQVRCKLTGHAATDAVGSDARFFIEAIFLATYGIKGKAAVPTDAAVEFLMGSTAFHCWPYWRELVQNVIARFGMPPLTVPLLKFDARGLIPASGVAEAESGTP